MESFFSFRIGVENIEMKQWRKKFWPDFIPHQNLESSDPCQIPNNFPKIGIVPLTPPWIQKRNVLSGDQLDICFSGGSEKKIFQDCPKLNSFLPIYLCNKMFYSILELVSKWTLTLILSTYL